MAIAGRRQFWGIWSVLFVCLLWGHYGLSPVTDFVGDDWAFLGTAKQQSTKTTAMETVRDYYRPLNMLALRMSFSCFGDRPWAFSALRAALHGGVLALYLAVLWYLFGKRALPLWVGGALYAFTPVLYDEFHWQCHGVLLYYPMAMLGAFLLWLDWLEKGRGYWRLLLSWIAYLAGLASYENFVPLALVFLLAGLMRGQGGRWKWSLVHLGLAAFYLVYRFTHGFGWGVPAIAAAYYSEGEGISLLGLLQNTRVILSWWIGGMMGKSFLGGFDAFSLLLPKWQVAFVTVSFIGLLAVWRAIHITTEMKTTLSVQTETSKCFLLGLVWMGLAYSPHLLFPVCSRHNLLPMFGAGMAMAAVFDRTLKKTPVWVWMGVGMLCLIANTGNGLAWKEAGVFCRKLYGYLDATQTQWQNKQLVVFDTLALRDRQTKSVTSPRNDSPATWAEYGNAILLRGFVGTGMLKLCVSNPPQGIQDTECGAHIDGPTLFWHERYNPSAPRETPLEDVYFVDVLAAVTDAGMRSRPLSLGPNP
jgi:hypothetical protein